MSFAALRRPRTIPIDPRLSSFLVDLFTYGIVSAVALGCDYGLLLALVRCGIHYLLASFLSFSVGAVVAYLLCVRFVFAGRRRESPAAEAAGFFAVGLAGLALTQILLFAMVSGLGLPVGLAKLPTVAIVFLFNFLCRRAFVFARSSRA